MSRAGSPVARPAVGDNDGGMKFAAFLTASLSLWLLLPVASFAQEAGAQPARPEKGMVITQDTTFAPGEYRLSSASLDEPALVIRGDGITVDFAGATLIGTEDPTR